MCRSYIQLLTKTFIISLCTLLCITTSTSFAQGGGGGGGGGGINGTSINCGQTIGFSLGSNGFTGSNPTSATGSCGQCCYAGSDLDGDGDQDVSFSTENGTWYEYCNNTGAAITIDIIVDETNNNCNLQGAVFVGPTSGGGTIDCSNAENQEYGSNAAGNADGFSFNNVTVPNGECAYIFIDGYAGAACGAATITIDCPCIPPVITANASPISVCAGQLVTLTASGASTYTWTASGGGGGLNATTGASVTANPTANTTYTVTGTDVNGCIGTTTVSITILPPPVPNAGNNQSGCAGSTFTIGADPIYNVAGTAYSWNNGAGSGVLDLSGGGQDHGTAVVSPASTTTYTVTITTAGGCVGTDDVTITITPPVTPTFNAIPNQCLNASAPSLPGTSTNGISGTWSPATITTSTIGTTTYTFTPGANQCAVGTTLNVTVTNPPIPTFNPLSSLCQNSSPPALPTSSLEGITGTWSPAVSTSTLGTSSYTFTPNAGQCSSTGTMDIIVISIPAPNAGNDLNGCLGEVFTIGGNPVYGTGGSGYSWSNGAGSGTITLSGNPNNQDNGQVDVSPASTTNYTVSVTDANSCIGTDGIVVTIDPCALPITFGSFEVKCSNGTELIWTTFSEINNDHFTIERKFGGENFEPIARIRGAGTSSSIKEYTFVDFNNPCNEETYYRLSQTDYNGVSEMLSVRSIFCANKSDEPIIRSAENFIEIIHNEPFTVYLYTTDGKLIHLEKSTSNHLKINNPSGANSLILVRVVASKEFVQKVIIQ